MKKFVFVLLACIFSFTSSVMAQMKVDVGVPGLAGRNCYTPEEAEAEQGIRIHSELMVIALNCQHMTPRGWKNFYVQYQGITARNANLIGGYENVLINFFALAGKGNPERAFHDMRTDFANKVSTDAARMRPDVFCANFANRLPKVDKMNSDDIQRWAASSSRSGASRPLCQP
jgi:hypothetical protein